MDLSWLEILSMATLYPFDFGTKLQVIITKMDLRIEERGAVVKGTPLVQPANDLFWFNRPHLLLYLIHFVLFQNAFQLAFFAWPAYEYGPKSCFHKNKADLWIKISMGYVTLPLYALVTQMGSTMKPTVFNDQVVKALHKWHQNAKKQVKLNRNSNSTTPGSTRPSTLSHSTSSSTSNHSAQLVSKFHDTVFEPRSPVGSLPSAANDVLVIDQHKIDVDSLEFSFEQYIELQI
ncbi:hypothetical protein L1987_04863 [Smallanthus sonchifolius]|uniref:Uncharacterized protein n=1 Tax=Smallanthus sonchifolius TaxID=185202 RepID=A0ACB9JTY2_9ASTR|nr:hypothetical protein L1987_04863 [Smallanthus sonchifolius]